MTSYLFSFFLSSGFFFLNFIGVWLVSDVV